MKKRIKKRTVSQRMFLYLNNNIKASKKQGGLYV